MGVSLVMAGRFGFNMLAEATREAAVLADGHRFAGWGTAYCYGTLLESVKQESKKPGELDFGCLSESKTDMALVHLTELNSGDSFPRPSEQQPLVRREPERTWAFCHDGRPITPAKLRTGTRMSDGSGMSERYFHHVLEAIDVDDPVESMTRMHAGLDDEPGQSMFLLSTDVLVVSVWDGSAEAGEPGSLWLGRGELMRVLAPMPLRSLDQFRWERIPNRTVLAFSRYRHEAE
jgi:hypothetical protein